MNARIIATGSYLPTQVVTNHDLAQKVDTSHDWIVQRTGIHQRHIAAPQERTSHLALHAAHQALDRGDIAPETIDMVICATCTPDDTFPATATHIARELGVIGGPAFDINGACGGFVYALAIADALMKTGQARRALVIGAETMSRIVDWTDRNTCVLFGDGAGAVVLEACDDPTQGILSTKLQAQGRHSDILHTTGGPSRTQNSGVITMQGLEVFKHAVEKMTAILLEACAAAQVNPADLDWVVPHQANARIMRLMAEKMQFPYDQVVETVDQQANTSAATIPLALHQACVDGRLKSGDLVGITALGAGLVWGAAVIRW